jgi:hypothetical protein
VWHRNVVSEDKVDEAVDVLYVTTRKASCEVEIKKKTRKE